jgi:hypothetical protein
MMKWRGGRAQFRVVFSADFPSCAVQPRNDAVMGAHFWPCWARAQNEPTYSDSIARADGGEGEAGWVGKGERG